MDAEGRFLAYATGQTAVLGVLAGVAGAMVLFTPFLGGVQQSYLAVEASGPGARATYRLLRALVPAMLVLYVVVPVVAGGVLAAAGRDAPGTWGVAFTAFALLLLFLTLFVVTSLFVGGVAGALVETRDGSAPMTAFAFDYEPTEDGRGVLTVAHDGGDTVAVGNLVVQGEGIADVPGANQTRTGPWQGATSEVAWRDEPVVAQGDAVAVGVEHNCVVRVVYEQAGNSATLAKHTCPGAEGG